jgi:hypothetical protein
MFGKMSSPQRRDTTFESGVDSETRSPPDHSGGSDASFESALALARSQGYQHPQNRNGIDWIGRAQQGGGKVPADFTWNSNPKQEQEDGSAH